MENVFCSLYTQSSMEPAAEKAALQELLLHLGQEAAQQQIERHSSSHRLDGMICRALEAASEHSDFSADDLERFCREMADETGRKLPQNRFELVHLGERFRRRNCNCAGMYPLIYGGLKGIAEYGMRLSGSSTPAPEITDYLKKILAYLLVPGLDTPELTALAQDCGRMCYHTFQQLSRKNRLDYGIPRPVRIRTSPVPGKAVLVAGQDFQVLADLLELARERDVRIYTCGELLSAHTYPGFQQYWQLAGHYGTTWKNHRKEFEDFPGTILLTSGCFRPDLRGLEDRCFSCGAVWTPGITHLKREELETVLENADKLPGFDRNFPEEAVSAGFGYEVLESSLPGIISMMERGALRHISIVGGCDRSENDGRYFPELIKQFPSDALILTFGCGKAHFHRDTAGRIGEFPRLLDMGQCSDVYGVIHFFRTMADRLGLEIGSLPVSVFISWNAERAIPAILTLAVSGFEEMFVGEGIPADILESLQNIAVIRTVSTPEKDLTLCGQAYR